jgi:antitoxin ParD1/3/4
MPAIERLTITLPSEMAAIVKGAVAGGLYASTSEVVREALRDWQIKAEMRQLRLDALRKDIDAGLKDVEEGRLVALDIDDVLDEGNRLSARREPSAWPPEHSVTLPGSRPICRARHRRTWRGG